MNRVYRLVWNRSLSSVQVVSELTRSRGSTSSKSTGRAIRRHPLALAMVALAFVCMSSPAWGQECTPADPSGCGAQGGQGGHPGRNNNGGSGNGTGGDATVFNPSSSEAVGNTASNGNGGSGADGVFDADSTNETSSGGSGGAVGATGSAGVGATVTGGTGGTGQASPADSFVGGGGGGGGAGVFINDGSSISSVTANHILTGGAGGVGGDALTATNADPGAGGGGGAGVIIGAGAGGVQLSNSGALKGGAGGAGGNGGYAGSGGGGGDGLLVLGVGAIVTNTVSGTITGGSGGSPGAFQDGQNEGGGYGGGGAGVNLVGIGVTLINTGTITGGGAGISALSSAQSGTPGVGLRGWGGVSVTDNGAIVGGSNSAGQVDAVLFTGGANSLLIESGASFGGNIESASGTTNGGDTLTLGGGLDGSLNAGLIVNFANDYKSGDSTWTLTGTGNANINWTIQQGQLVGNVASLAGNLNFDNSGMGISPSVDFNQTTDGIFGNLISGNGAVYKDGVGTLTLTGTNTYTGGTSILGGTLAVAANANLGGSGGLTLSGGTLENTSAFTTGRTVTLFVGNGTIQTDVDLTITGNLTGPGALTKAGGATLILLGNDSYDGGTVISEGALQGTTSSLVGNIADNAALVFSQATDGSYSGVISGNGALDKLGSGTVTLTAPNTYSGGTVIIEGTLQGTTSSLQGNINDNATLSFNQSTNGTYSGEIFGGGAMEKLGTGTLTLSGDNIYTGGTTISAGTLQGDTISLQGNIDNNATLTFNQAADGTYSGIISGTGSMSKVGTGTLTLTGSNSYAGGSTINAGTLQGNTASVQGNISDNAALVFDQSTAGTYGGIISGAGTLAISGGGNVTLNGANANSGLTTVAADTTLIVGDSSHTTASVGGDVSVDGGTLGGYGIVEGSATLSNNATLLPGNTNAIGKLTINGGLDIGDGTQLNFDFGAPGPDFSTPGQSDNVVVNGNLTIDSATLNVSNLGSMGPGLYNLFQWGQTLQFNNGGFAPPPGMSLQILTADRQINLIDTSNVTLDEWDANGQAGPSSMGGGSGTWSVSSNTWSNTNGQYVGPMAPQPGFAIFGGASGTVTVDDTNGEVSVTGMQFVSDGYHLTGDAIDLVEQNGTAPVLRVSSGDTAIIDNVLEGTNGFNKTDGGTLVLTGSNTFTGTTTLSGGYLSVSSDANLGAPTNTLNFEGGTLEITGTAFTQTARTIIWGSAGGGFDIDDASNTFIVSQALTGSGGLLKSGAGSLVLSGTNTYSGGTVVDAGTLQGDTTSLQGNIINNATLDFTQTANGTFSGAISGSGQLIKNGSGTLILSGANTYTGGTMLDAGTLQGDATSLQGNIVNNAALVFDQASDGTYSGDISGNGTLTKSGAGTLSLTGANTYSGPTTINAGVLLGDTNSLQGNIVNNATLAFNQTNDGAFNGVISGIGSILKSGAGTLTLTGANVYTGGTTISAGTLQGDTGSLQGNIVDNATLAFNQANNGSFNGVVSGSGSVIKSGAGVLSLTGVNTYSGGTTINVGTLQGDTNSLQGNMVDNATLLFAQTTTGTFAGAISGSGQLVKNGAGVLILSGTDSHTGGTTITAGALQASTTSLQGNVVDNAQLIFDQTGNGTFNGAISGSGAVTLAGSGTVVLQAANSYTGGTTITSGALEGDSASLQGNIVNNGAVIFDQTANGTYDGSLSGTGTLILVGGGTLILDGSNTYTGSTTVSAGTLEVGDSSSTSASITSAVNVQDGGTLRGHGTINGDVTNDGIVWPGGSVGTLTVNGNYTQNADGTLEFDVTPSQASMLKVSGSASLAGTLDLIFAPGTYTADTFNLVQAGSVTGKFATVNGTVPGSIASQIDYSATGVALVLARSSVSPLDGSLFGNTLRNVDLTGQQDMSSVLDTALATSGTSCTGEHASSMQNVTSSCAGGAWAQYTGSNISLGGANGANSTAFGLLGGSDYELGDVVHAGIDAGVGQVNSNDKLGGNSRAENVHGGLYAYANAGPIVVSGVIDDMHSDYHFNRATGIGTATSTPDGNLQSAGVQIAWPLQLSAWQFTPKVGALYQHQTLDGFGETLYSSNPNVASFPVDGDRSRFTNMQPYTQLELGQTFIAHGVTYVPQLSVGYRYNTHNDAAPTVQVTSQDGTVFNLPSASQSRGMATASARITAQAGASWSLYADYEGFFGSNLHDNALSVGFTKHF